MKHKNELLVHDELVYFAEVNPNLYESRLIEAIHCFIEDQQIQLSPVMPQKHRIWEDSFSQEACKRTFMFKSFAYYG